MSMAYEEYMRQMILPMRKELTEQGFKELTTKEQVDQFVETVKGTALVVVNSVCGCAAGLARPAATLSLQHEKHPDHAVTVFAGQDLDATEAMRMYFGDYAPSSPSMALLKDGQVVYFMPREEIENHSIEAILQKLTDAYHQFCS